MPSERGDGQKLIPVPMSESFIERLNAGFKLAGYANRSQFVRDAIIEKLANLGITIPSELALAPDRLGKGGRSRSSYQINPSTSALNETNYASGLGTALISQGVSAGEHSFAKRKPKGKARPRAKVVHPPAKPPGAPLNSS